MVVPTVFVQEHLYNQPISIVFTILRLIYKIKIKDKEYRSTGIYWIFAVKLQYILNIEQPVGQMPHTLSLSLSLSIYLYF